MASTMSLRPAHRVIAAVFLLASLVTADTAQSGQVIPTPTAVPAMNALTYMGCFDDPTPMLDHGPYTFQSSGNCQPICYGLKMPVMGLTGGSNCWCGQYVPPVKAQVSNDTCSTPCSGYNKEKCGGDGVWTVYLTGITQNKIAFWDPDTNGPSTSTLQHVNAPSVVTIGSTVVQTIGSETGGVNHGHKGGPNTAGIAAGVVVGVVALGGIILGAWFYLRQRRRREIEEEHRRAAAVSEFVKGGRSQNSGSSINDNRLDPEVMGHRRMSDGSIADNEDYSRRILKVTNA